MMYSAYHKRLIHVICNCYGHAWVTNSLVCWHWHCVRSMSSLKTSSCSLNSMQRQSISQEWIPSLVTNCADGVVVANVHLMHPSFDRSFSCALQLLSTSDMSLNTVQVASIWTFTGGRTDSKLGWCSASCSGVVLLFQSLGHLPR